MVREGIEPGFTVVRAHTTIADTTEGEPMHGEVNDGIVDGFGNNL